MSKAQPLSGKNREQRHSRREQHYIPEKEYIRLDESEFYAFVESASDRAVKYAVRDYVDSKDFITNKQLDERLSHTEKLFDEKLKTTEANIIGQLRQEINDLGTALRQEMGQQNTALRQEMGQQNTALRQEMGQMGNKMLGGFTALAVLITFLAWIGGAFSKAEPQQSTQYVPVVPYSLEQLQAPKAPNAAP